MINQGKTTLSIERNLFRSLSLFVLAALIAQPAYSSQDSLLANKRPFQLNASVDERPQLTRDELSSSGGAGQTPYGSSAGPLGDNEALPMPDMVAPASIPELAPRSGPGIATTSSPPGFPLSARQDEPRQQGPDGAMTEFGVDWSKWISQLADRWFVHLKRMEDQSGLQFHTTGPALIQFTAFPNGQIANVSLKKTSGVELYDRMQMQALLNSMPAPPFPKGTRRTSFTLVQGWESHPRRPGEQDYQPGSFGHGFPMEKVKQWVNFLTQ